MESIVIRRVTEADIESIKIIYEKAFDRHEGVLKYYLGFSEYVSFCIQQNYSYMAINNGAPCGVLLSYMKPDMSEGKSLYVELLAVMPEYQKKGIGTRLLNTVKEAAQSGGFSELSLRTACYMDSYLIYRKYGFKDTRDDHRYMVMNIKKNKPE